MRRPLDALPFVVLLFVLARARPAVARVVVPSVPRTGGGPLTIGELRQLAARVGFPDPDLAAAVAMGESGGKVDNVGDNGDSLGLWQINIPAHPEVDKARLFDAEYNARAALAISHGGVDWTPWTVYRTGAYRAHMPRPNVV